jgi:hypothetical protein
MAAPAVFGRCPMKRDNLSKIERTYDSGVDACHEEFVSME